MIYAIVCRKFDSKSACFGFQRETTTIGPHLTVWKCIFRLVRYLGSTLSFQRKQLLSVPSKILPSCLCCKPSVLIASRGKNCSLNNLFSQVCKAIIIIRFWATVCQKLSRKQSGAELINWNNDRKFPLSIPLFEQRRSIFLHLEAAWPFFFPFLPNLALISQIRVWLLLLVARYSQSKKPSREVLRISCHRKMAIPAQIASFPCQEYFHWQEYFP